jgi:hypothetical protein
LNRVTRDLEHVKLMLGRNMAMSLPVEASELAQVEFKVFSQWGDDGIIQFLLRRLSLPREKQTFVEFGVENFEEANTRFLMMNDNWRGLVMDGDPRNIEYVKSQPWFWQFDLTAVAAFVDRDNINDILVREGYGGELGLLHIDIDGNDYWVWKAITVASPAIAVIEYNSVFGGIHAVSVPYDPAFQRTRAHYSNQYFGASLGALLHLAKEKGYVFVGTNCAGNNAYFVRSDLASGFRPLTLAEGFVDACFRDSRGTDGALTYLRQRDRLGAIKSMQVVEVTTGRQVTISDLYGV